MFSRRKLFEMIGIGSAAAVMPKVFASPAQAVWIDGPRMNVGLFDKLPEHLRNAWIHGDIENLRYDEDKQMLTCRLTGAPGSVISRSGRYWLKT